MPKDEKPALKSAESGLKIKKAEVESGIAEKSIPNQAAGRRVLV
jgi:hypothetical protein